MSQIVQRCVTIGRNQRPGRRAKVVFKDSTAAILYENVIF